MKRFIIQFTKHWDFILMDLVALLASYLCTCLIRYRMIESLGMRITRGDLFWKCGIVLFVCYFLVGQLTYNYSGILHRSVVKEFPHVLSQMVLTWSVFTAVLFMIREAHEYSRNVYVISFVLGLVFVYVARSIGKMLLTYTPLKKRICQKLMVICDRDLAQNCITSLLYDMYDGRYEICGVCMTAEGTATYADYFPAVYGLEHLQEFLEEKRPEQAYVRISDGEQEELVIEMLLDRGIIVHKGLGESDLHYRFQTLNKLSNQDVVTIRDNHKSWTRIVEDWFENIRKR